MDALEWETVAQLGTRTKERDILKVSKLWGNKSVVEQFLAEEAPTTGNYPDQVIFVLLLFL